MVNQYVQFICNLSVPRQTVLNAIDCLLKNKISANQDQPV
jgi:hypothetical protein